MREDGVVSFFIEWWLAVHRAAWFPVHWALGLERPGIVVPMFEDDTAGPKRGTGKSAAAPAAHATPPTTVEQRET